MINFRFSFLKALSLASVLAVTASLSSYADEEAVKKAAQAGKSQFLTCAACHGNDGKGRELAPGMKMAPSFFDSELIKLDPEVTAVILLKGIKKEDPAAYAGQMMMALGAALDDKTLANLITYIRSEYGDKKELTTAEQVAEWKKKHKETTMPTRKELKALGEERAKMDKKEEKK